MPSLSELRVAASFLRQACVLCEGVRDLFVGHDTGAAARLGDIAKQIETEGDHIERLIANGGRQ